MRKIVALLFLLMLIGACSSSSNVAEDTQFVIPESETIYDESSPMPVMIGGMEAFYSNLRYPNASRDNNHQGRVLLDFVVSRDGIPANIEVRRSSGHRLLDQAAINALRQTRFEPGKIDGEAVAVCMIQPVIFRLQ
ncbi:MAG: energy transducer TonB [Balneolales bacterium]|nr:energy transducer TonB [Balneolales bacterium]